jgi:hypothetical protein
MFRVVRRMAPKVTHPPLPPPACLKLSHYRETGAGRQQAVHKELMVFPVFNKARSSKLHIQVKFPLKKISLKARDIAQYTVLV